MNILVIEDDPKIREGLVELLKNDGNDVDSAENGEIGIEYINKKNYDIVLTDLIMPISNGMDVLRAAKKNTSKTQIIFITAFATVENAVEAIKAGASEYITKPFKVDEVKIKIQKVIAEADFKKRLPLNDIKIIKALSNQIRQDVLFLLNKHGKLRFTDIKNILKITDATKLSFHLRILKNLKLIDQDQVKIYKLTTRGQRIFKGSHNGNY